MDFFPGNSRIVSCIYNDGIPLRVLDSATQSGNKSGVPCAFNMIFTLEFDLMSLLLFVCLLVPFCCLPSEDPFYLSDSIPSA